MDVRQTVYEQLVSRNKRDVEPFKDLVLSMGKLYGENELLKEKCSALQREVESLSQEKDQLQGDKQVLESQIAALREVASVPSNVDLAYLEETLANEKRLDLVASELSKQLDATKMEVIEAYKEKSDILQDLSSRNMELKIMMGSLEAKDQGLSKAHDFISDLGNQNTSLRSKLDQATETISILQGELASAKKHISTLSKQLSTQQASNRSGLLHSADSVTNYGGSTAPIPSSLLESPVLSHASTQLNTPPANHAIESLESLLGSVSLLQVPLLSQPLDVPKPASASPGSHQGSPSKDSPTRQAIQQSPQLTRVSASVLTRKNSAPASIETNKGLSSKDQPPVGVPAKFVNPITLLDQIEMRQYKEVQPEGGEVSTRIPTFCLPLPITGPRHQQAVNCLCYNSMGTFLATGSDDTSIILWNMHSRTPSARLTGAVRGVMSVAFSPDDLLVLGCSNDRCARIWSVSGDLKETFSGHLDQVVTGGFLTHEKIITGSIDRALRVFDLHSRKCDKTIRCPSACHDLCVATGLLISAHADRTIRFWDYRTGDFAFSIDDAHRNQVTSVCASPDGRYILTNGKDHVLHLFDVMSCQKLHTYQAAEYCNMRKWTKACFSSGGNHVLSGTTGKVCIWDRDSTKLLTTLQSKFSSPNPVLSCACNPRENQIVSSEGSFCLLWE
ncbi:autophagy protein 16 [Pelomyxa schiedti]|nr:autophagy protein 16 [Pelomyxa schiedti]